MKRLLSGFSTVEVMVMLVAISLIIFAAFGAKSASYQIYKDIVHRERAQLWLTESFEILEAMRSTELHKNYLEGWDSFVGSLSDGTYRLVKNTDDPGYILESWTEPGNFSDTDVNVVKMYGEYDDLEAALAFQDGIFTRLERRLSVEEYSGATEAGSQKVVSCSIYWGVSGNYFPETTKLVSMEVLYSDETLPAFAL